MIVTLAFLVVVAIIVVWWLLPQNLTAKPWLAHGPIEDPRPERDFPTAKIGLWVLLAVVSSVFALFVSAYSIRMGLADWKPLPDPTLLWINTGVLLLGSAAFQRARNATQREQLHGVRTSLIAAGILTFAFLAGQLLAWRQLNASGYFIYANPANAFFYLITALHGLHLLGGLWVWSRTTYKVFRGADAGKIALSVELCTIYWHYLLLVWLALFGLLLST